MHYRLNVTALPSLRGQNYGRELLYANKHTRITLVGGKKFVTLKPRW